MILFVLLLSPTKMINNNILATTIHLMNNFMRLSTFDGSHFISGFNSIRFSFLFSYSFFFCAFCSMSNWLESWCKKFAKSWYSIDDYFSINIYYLSSSLFSANKWNKWTINLSPVVSASPPDGVMTFSKRFSGCVLVCNFGNAHQNYNWFCPAAMFAMALQLAA